MQVRLLVLYYDDFVSKMKAVFDHPYHYVIASKCVLHLRQGSRSVADYSVDFLTLAVDSQWNDKALRGTFVSRD